MTDSYMWETGRGAGSSYIWRRRQRRAACLVGSGAATLLSALVLLLAAGCAGEEVAGSDDEASGAASTEATASVSSTIGEVSGAGPAPGIDATPTTVTPPASPGDLSGRIICIDPGHAAITDSGTEPVGPGSTEMKVKDPGGTSGVVTGTRESVVTLAIAQYLKQMLEAEGAKVVMTREGESFFGGNRERAQIANEAGADLFIRIHCDGSSDPSRRGVSTLYPAAISGWTDDIHDRSTQAATAVQSSMASGLGAPDLGTVARDDITGFNWADVPAILVETGFMSNVEDDLLLNQPSYQRQVAAALRAGIGEFLASG